MGEFALGFRFELWFEGSVVWGGRYCCICNLSLIAEVGVF
jgi:hypothetical protein